MSDVLAFLAAHGECTVEMITVIPMGTGPSRMVRLFNLGQVIRRKVRLNPKSTRELYAYRLPGQQTSLMSLGDHVDEEVGVPIPPALRLRGEPGYSHVLRNLGRYEGQQ